MARGAGGRGGAGRTRRRRGLCRVGLCAGLDLVHWSRRQRHAFILHPSMLALRCAARLLAPSAQQQVGKCGGLRRPRGRSAPAAATLRGQLRTMANSGGGEPAHTNRLAKEQSPCECCCARAPAAAPARQAVTCGMPVMRSSSPIGHWCATRRRRTGAAAAARLTALLCCLSLPHLAFHQTCCSMLTTRWTGTPGARRRLRRLARRTSRSSCRWGTRPATGELTDTAVAAACEHRPASPQSAQLPLLSTAVHLVLPLDLHTDCRCHVMERESFESEEVAALM